ncbi:MAG: uroporphyrinogen-III C-methyltransferase [Betaproteobacteria bacterium]|nr:MAG: uroporphyrinogen-III C-methyltransferase [Betaproteobacteria bacterium]
MASKRGKVYLIGAGPGAADLLTLRAARALARAEVVLVDDLVERATLDHCRAGARVLHVGKRGGCRSTPQRFIERLMLNHAAEGRVVARLKGGDPFVFGRGREECDYLMGHGVDVEVIPGLTAGVALPELLGIPVTHRGLASGVAFVTGHTGASAEPDWTRLARLGTTLVVYMGLARLEHIAERLVAGGMRHDMPAAVISRGGLPGEQHVVAPLRDLARISRNAGLAAPALIVIGEVVTLASCSARRTEQQREIGLEPGTKETRS